MIEPLSTVVLFIIHGVLGALAYCLIWREYEREELMRRLSLGAIAGYLYSYMVINYSLPDGIIAFIVGYWCVDFIEALAERFREYVRVKGEHHQEH